MGGINPADLASRLEETKTEAINEEESKCIRYLIENFRILEKANFKKKMKNHYKGEFNMAALLKAKPPMDEEDDEEDEK